MIKLSTRGTCTLNSIVWGDLKKWSMEEFGKEINKLKELFARLKQEPGCRGPSREEIKVQDQLAKLFHREEVMWR